MRDFKPVAAVLLAAVSLASTGTASAAVLAIYEFQAGSLASTDVDAASAASNFGNSGLADFNQGNAYSFLDTDIDTDTDIGTGTGDYLSFSLTPAAGGTLDLTALSFSGYRLGAGTTTGTVEVRTSLDGFASALNIFNTSTFTAGTTQTLTAPPATGFFVDVGSALFDNIDDNGVEFRFFFTGSVGGPPNRRNVIDDVTVTGTATAVPLPAPLLLLGSAIASLGLNRRRRA
jgi:hypothetical protein